MQNADIYFCKNTLLLKNILNYLSCFFVITFVIICKEDILYPLNYKCKHQVTELCCLDVNCQFIMCILLLKRGSKQARPIDQKNKKNKKERL